MLLVEEQSRSEIEALTEPFNYLEYLRCVATDTTRPKRDRTKYQLHLAILSLADQENLEDILIDDVVKKAVVARGTFYQYYPNTMALLTDAIRDFFATTWQHRPADRLFRDALSYIYVTRLYSARTFGATPKLFFWYWYLSRRNPELVAERAEMAGRSSQFMLSLLDAKIALRDDERALNAMLRSAALMWNEMQVSYFIEEDPILTRSIRTETELTELSVKAWFRLVYGEDITRTNPVISVDLSKVTLEKT
jgi:AcrR family transcriptional regulator